MLKYGIRTNQNLRRIKFSRALQYKQITKFRTEILINQKKIICHLVDFAILVDDWVKMN